MFINPASFGGVYRPGFRHIETQCSRAWHGASSVTQDLAEVEYRFFSRGVADAKAQADASSG